MKIKTSRELRETFLRFFEKSGHEIITSASLIPSNDPTLLFTNAGMVPFKNVFLGREKRPYARAASIQRCVRAGGKHNDLENVGYTARHHTFFEMLGNFSFGDYFKREAIRYAWTFLTDVLEIPEERLWVTVYKEDHETEKIWLKEIKINHERFSRCEEISNFWAMGDTGPCGPCTEIFYDHGPEIPGGPPGSFDKDADRYVEIWNVVFMQYERSLDGKLNLIPKPSVDTGMGLERLAAVMQGVHNNYDTDLFQPLIKAVYKLVKIRDSQDRSLFIIADHIRSCSFLIADGVVPSNEGRGYVLRRIIRRALRHGNQLGLHGAFFYKLVRPLVNEMQETYPELASKQVYIERTLRGEEEQFERTLDQGLRLLEEEIKKISGKQISGEVVFRLYDTYGFPADLTADLAREKGFFIDQKGFERAMEQQQKRSKASSQFKKDYTDKLAIKGKTQFIGYDCLQDKAIVTGLFHSNKVVNQLKQGEDGIVVLDRTPFYAESGGQVGDKGQLCFEGGHFEVSDTQKQGDVHLHMGHLDKGTLKIGQKLDAKVSSLRQAIVLNHSATHLLHAALRKVLGDHVIQKGSLVEADRLRFDFSYPEPVKQEQLRAVERLVNQQIRANLKGNIEIMLPEEAIKRGALALFGEKYGAEVRVLTFGNFSMELCGGTHVYRTGDIGFFKIISETGVAAGIRRIEALTGEEVLNWISGIEDEIQQITSLLKTDKKTVAKKLEQLLEQWQVQEKELEKLRNQWVSRASDKLLGNVVTVGNINVLSRQVHAIDVKNLRNMVDQLKQKLSPAVVMLASEKSSKINLIAGVTHEISDKVNAGELVAYVAEQIGGKGGGRADMAQGGGDCVEKLDQALTSVVDWVKEKSR